MHTHEYHLIRNIMLTVPTVSGDHRRTVLWHCACGHTIGYTGEFSVHEPPLSEAAMMAIHRAAKKRA